MIKNVEYRLRPVTRYVITRYEDQLEAGTGGVRTIGEYPNQETAYEVGYALCKAEHEKLGWPVGDERILYPQRIPENVSYPPPVTPSRSPAEAHSVSPS